MIMNIKSGKICKTVNNHELSYESSAPPTRVGVAAEMVKTVGVADLLRTCLV